MISATAPFFMIKCIHTVFLSIREMIPMIARIGIAIFTRPPMNINSRAIGRNTRVSITLVIPHAALNANTISSPKTAIIMAKNNNVNIFTVSFPGSWALFCVRNGIYPWGQVCWRTQGYFPFSQSFCKALPVHQYPYDGLLELIVSIIVNLAVLIKNAKRKGILCLISSFFPN